MSEEEQRPQRLSKAALIAMGLIVAALSAVAIHANWQNAHRDKIESVTITHFTPSPSPFPTPP